VKGVYSKMKIRKLLREDEPRWRELWGGYLRFYRQRLPEDITARTLERLVDPSGDLQGLVAESDGVIVGFTNYLYHASSWSKSAVCYLEDLYVDPRARGRGAARALIQAVYAAADAHGAQTVYWMTQEFNADGRALYDTLARRTSFIRYER
jgi:GNAT superfamily N-acetyltransferase